MFFYFTCDKVQFPNLNIFRALHEGQLGTWAQKIIGRQSIDDILALYYYNISISHNYILTEHNLLSFLFSKMEVTLVWEY